MEFIWEATRQRGLVVVVAAAVAGRHSQITSSQVTQRAFRSIVNRKTKGGRRSPTRLENVRDRLVSVSR